MEEAIENTHVAVEDHHHIDFIPFSHIAECQRNIIPRNADERMLHMHKGCIVLFDDKRIGFFTRVL